MQQGEFPGTGLILHGLGLVALLLNVILVSIFLQNDKFSDVSAVNADCKGSALQTTVPTYYMTRR